MHTPVPGGTLPGSLSQHRESEIQPVTDTGGQLAVNQKKRELAAKLASEVQIPWSSFTLVRML